MSKLSNVSHEKVADLRKKRRKESVAVTFNNLGIVVPYDKKTELGYRPLPLSKSELSTVKPLITNSLREESSLSIPFPIPFLFEEGNLQHGPNSEVLL